MKKPYLARYIENHNFVKEDRFHYDEVSQLSYLCTDRAIKVIDKACFGGSSVHTFSDECSDPDEMNFIGSTILTEDTGENSDFDEMHAIGISYATRTVEESDPNELLLRESTFTHSIESSDPDDIHMIDSSIKTATDETSDPDEMRFNYFNKASFI